MALKWGLMAQHSDNKPLAGRRVALPESRELDLFAGMLEQRGAAVWRCPLVAIRDAPDPAPVRAWLGELVRGQLHDVVLYTGEGVRRLIGVADRDGMRDAAIAALGRARKITRGPKPIKALREIALRTDVKAAAPTTAGVIEALGQLSLARRTIGVQLYGSERNETLMTFLREHGAEPRPVHPYVYASSADDQRVIELIEALASGEVDLIAFTGSPQVRRLWDLAAQQGCTERLEEGCRRAQVAAVGPVVAAALRERGAPVDVMPDGRYTLRPLTDAMIASLH